MPLREQTIVDLRKEMMEAVRRGHSIAEVARMFGVSRPTVYEWLRRYDPDDPSTLQDRSRAPNERPSKTDVAIEQRLIEERERWGFGSKKILARLSETEPDLSWPHRSTVDGIFKRAGLVRSRRKRRPSSNAPFARRYDPSKPGELSTIDFKGQFRLGDGRYCYPLTMADYVSRYVIVAQALPSTELAPAWRVIERAFREHGLPTAMQSDNGPPFGHGNARLSTMSVRLMKLGVQPIFSRPGKPQDNGVHERMHATLKQAATIPPGKNLRHQQTKLDAFRQMFNHERPHEALGMERPARIYRGSPQAFPTRPPTIEYDSSFEVRRVGHHGEIKWRGTPIFISHALAGELIALETIDYESYQVHFTNFRIGKLHQGRFI